ncbi:hypothetical protein QCN29_00490 [Streptomyces sp. HNM0663]|uniref:SecDF P1 head subdomain domain-containing protein n=1 Tax=Streptomyces chengmaiensis TaxID=3040919 RepID=A0ABT6HG79_9ACTN|nr:hypothetical protein [Streptomyces chengmaiensis]MDH2387287.1 hypothetical protein [Streptomyces chengmaiensis]
MLHSRHAACVLVSLCAGAVALVGCSGPSGTPKGTSSGDAGRGAAADAAGAAGGSRSVVTFAARPPATADAVRKTVERLRQRADALGMAGVRVAAEGDSITVAGPSSDEERMKHLGDAGELHFRPVLAAAPGATLPAGRSAGRPAVPSASPSAVPSAVPNAGPSANTSEPGAALQAEFAALDCSGRTRTDAGRRDAGRRADSQEPITACGAAGETPGPPEKYLLGPAALDGSGISSAEAVLDAQFGGWIVQLDFNAEGTRKFADITGDLAVRTAPQNRFAIVLDGEVVSAPAVTQRLPGGKAQISGKFTRGSAEELAATLNSGSLPTELEITSLTQVTKP